MLTRPTEQPAASRASGRAAATGWDAARERAHAAVASLPPRIARLDRAAGLRLAVPLRALTALPAQDRSAMDGYAVRGGPPWEVVGSGTVDAPAAPALACGGAYRVVTGAALPPMTSAVLPEERTRRSGGHVTGTVVPGAHIRRAGEECELGDEVLPAGAVLHAVALGLAAAAGHDSLLVHPRPTVAIIVTGDELVLRGVPPAGRVRDAIGPVLPGLVAGAGGSSGEPTWLSDDADGLRAAIGEADADVVLVSGSSAAGPADHLHGTLRRLGARLVVDGVACRPGHPQLLALLPGGRVVVGLPGNPLAAVAAVPTLVAPVLAALAGRPLPALPRYRAHGLTARPDRTVLVPVRVQGGRLSPVPHHGPGMLRGAALADGLAVVDPGTGPVGQARLHRFGPPPAEGSW